MDKRQVIVIGGGPAGLAAAAALTYEDAVRARNKRARAARRREIARSRAAFEQALEQRSVSQHRQRVCA